MPDTRDSNEDGGAPIRDAACLVLVDRSAVEPRLLLGRRPATQVFLPNKWVFPGGRVDEDDHAFAALIGDGQDALASFACAAVRETYEETGILFDGAEPPSGTLPPAWERFAALGVMPGIGRLTPFARAITPPGFPRRFDTWFYLAEWDAGRLPQGTPDGELQGLGWFTIAEVRALDLAIITRLIVDDVAIALAPGADPREVGIPFYYQGVDGYIRALLGGTMPVASP